MSNEDCCRTTTWLVEHGGVMIGTAGIDRPGMIRISGSADHPLTEAEARDLLVRALALLGGVKEGASETEKVLLEILSHHVRQRQEAQEKLEAALAETTELKVERAVLLGENHRLGSELGQCRQKLGE